MTIDARTLPLLDEGQMLAALRVLRSRQPVEYWAFYSSQLEGDRHRPGADGDPVRRSHGPSRPRHLRHGRDRRRQDLRPRGAPRSLPSVGRALEADDCPARARRCATSSSDGGGKRPARRRDSLLVVVGAGQPRAEPRRRCRARLLRDDLRGPRRIPSGGTPKA